MLGAEFDGRVTEPAERLLGPTMAGRHEAPVGHIQRADLLAVLTDTLWAGTVGPGRRATDFYVKEGGAMVR